MVKSKKTRAVERLQRQLDEISTLKQQRHGSPEFIKWARDTEVAIRYTFGETSSQNEEFKSINYSSIVVTDDHIEQRFYEDGLNVAASILQSMIDEIEEYWEDEDQVAGVDPTVRTTKEPS